MQEETVPPVESQPSAEGATSPKSSSKGGAKPVKLKRAVAQKAAPPKVAVSKGVESKSVATRKPRPKAATPKPAPKPPAGQQVGPAAAPPPPPRPTASAAPPRPAAPAAAPPAAPADSEQPESAYGKSFMLFNVTPGWLVSMAAHAVLLIVLALFHVTGAAKRVQEIVLLDDDIAEQEVELFEPVEIEMDDLEVQEISTQALSAQDMGIADLGSPQLMPNAVKVDMGAVGPAMEDIGLLFGSEGKGMADTGAGYGGAEFFGVKAGGRKFVFIVDSSLSMKGGKFEAACYELEQAVRRLGEDQLFYVMFFDWDSNHLHLGTWDRSHRNWTVNPEPEERAVFATQENKEQVGLWMKTVELELKTLVLESVQDAMEMYPDAIYILTDGKFGDTRKVEKYLEENNYTTDEQGNKRAKVIIHTVGFYNRDGEPVLKKMADNYGGTYRFVPQPGKPGK